VDGKTLPRAILGLDRDFPDQVIVLHHPPSGRYGCYRFGGVHGLACFSTPNAALHFALEALEPTVPGLVLQSVTFDEAREVAKSRPFPVVAVMLLDDLDDPVIHYVK
jgi:hypothetical protein